MKYLNVLAWALIFLTAGGSAVQAVTLEDLMDAASTDRDAVKAYQLRVRQEQASVREARASFLPRLDAGFTVNQLDNQGIIEYKKNHATYASLSWNVVSGFRDRHLLAAARNLETATTAELEGLRQDIRLNVALAFINLYSGLASQKVAGDALALYKERYANVELKTRVGILTRSDLLKIQVEMDQAELDVNRAEAGVRQAMNLLSFETGVPVTADQIDFSVFDNMPEIGAEPDYQAAMLEKHSALKGLKAGIRAAGSALSAEKAAYYPFVDLAVSATHSEDDLLPDTGDIKDEEYRARGTVTLNLYDGSAKYARIARARLEVTRLEHQYQETLLQLKTALKNRLLDAELAGRNLAVAEASVASAEENMRVTDFSFQKGISTSADLLDAIFYLSRARSSRIEARTGLFAEAFRLKRLAEDL